MAILKAFKGLRPPQTIVKDLASRPYDVLNSEEAREEAKGNPWSLLHIIKPEIDLPPAIDIHSQEVYNKAKENFELFKQKGFLVQDDINLLYIYAQTMNGKTQYGIVGCAGAGVSQCTCIGDGGANHSLSRTKLGNGEYRRRDSNIGYCRVI